jgi:molecular chaperone IbpA
VNYPPYNIVRTGRNQFNIELALAGYNKKDIEVTVEEGQLTVKSKRAEHTESKDANSEMLHKGIASRYFERSFTIADDIEIQSAELKDGLLTISLEKIVPESKKLRTIEIL